MQKRPLGRITVDLMSGSVAVVELFVALKGDEMIGLDEANNNRQKSVLIVDDARLMRHLIGHFVESMGYSTVHAENGQIAWQKVLQRIPDLVITDLEMPIFNGFELIEHIRSSNDKRVRPIPIFVCSSMTRDLQAVDPIVRVDRILNKPINLAALRKCLDELAN